MNEKYKNVKKNIDCIYRKMQKSNLLENKIISIKIETLNIIYKKHNLQQRIYYILSNNLANKSVRYFVPQNHLDFTNFDG